MDIKVGQLYVNTGEALPWGNDDGWVVQQKELRKKLKLPLRKQIVYYYPPYNETSKPVPVVSFYAATFKNRSGKEDPWYIVKLQLLGDDKPRLIHGDFLADMQNKKFIQRFNRDFRTIPREEGDY